MESLQVGDVEELIKAGSSYEEISNTLKTRFPGKRGFSVRSIKRFCSANGLSTRVQTEFIVNEVTKAINEVFRHLFIHVN